MGGAISAFVAAAAMATGSAAPAKADFEDLLDPIIQPLLTSFTDAVSVVDPAAALDLTSWTDSLLGSISSLDLALPAAAEPGAALAASAGPAASTGGTIPLSLLEGTEPAVNASINGGGSVPLLVDTGSSGLVVPYTDLGSNFFTQLEALFNLGFPANFGLSGYSGGVEYLYATYNNVPVDYAGGIDTEGPVDVELFSWSTNASNPLDNFQSFLSSNDVDGVLGVGPDTAGPTTSPFESFGSVTVDISNPTAGTGDLILGGNNPFPGTDTLSGAPISVAWVSVNGALPEEVTNDVDSGGATGELPADVFTTNEYNSTTDLVNPGTEIAVYADKAETDLL